MAKITNNPSISLKINLDLDEDEARVLELLGQFPFDEVKQLLVTNLAGEFEQHSKGLKKLLVDSRPILSDSLRRLNDARKAFGG